MYFLKYKIVILAIIYLHCIYLSNSKNNLIHKFRCVFRNQVWGRHIGDFFRWNGVSHSKKNCPPPSLVKIFKFRERKITFMWNLHSFSHFPKLFPLLYIINWAAYSQKIMILGGVTPLWLNLPPPRIPYVTVRHFYIVHIVSGLT